MWRVGRENFTTIRSFYSSSDTVCLRATLTQKSRQSAYHESITYHAYHMSRKQCRMRPTSRNSNVLTYQETSKTALRDHLSMQPSRYITQTQKSRQSAYHESIRYHAYHISRGQRRMRATSRNSNILTYQETSKTALRDHLSMQPRTRGDLAAKQDFRSCEKTNLRPRRCPKGRKTGEMAKKSER